MGILKRKKLRGQASLLQKQKQGPQLEQKQITGA